MSRKTGHRQRRCSGGIEEDKAAGMPGMASGVEEEDGTMAIDCGAGGGAALSSWRKATTSGVEEEDGTTTIDGGMGGGASLLFGLKSNKTGKNCLLSLTPQITLLGVKSFRKIFV